jgi:hypothetical protein
MGATLTALATAVGIALLAPAAAVATAVTTVPFHDPDAVGTVGLCDRSGHQVTQGSTAAAPFAWRAVASTPAAASYGGAGRTAMLQVFDPMQGIAPSVWSGAPLTASSRYTDSAHPMAAGTGADDSLADIMSDFAPHWDGMFQLRLLLGAPGRQPLATRYAATVIQVTGDTWRVVDPQPAACTSGRSTSIESVLLPRSATHPSHSSAAAGSHRPAPATVDVRQAAVSRPTSHSPARIAIAMVAVLALGTGFVLGRRRRNG